MSRDDFEDGILPLFEEHRPDWLASARAIALALGASGAIVCIDDVREQIEPPPDKDGRVMGAVFLHSQWDLIRRARSGRHKCHNRPIGYWRLKGFGGNGNEGVQVDLKL